MARTWIALAALLLMIPPADPAKALTEQRPERIPFEELERHRLQGERYVRAAEAAGRRLEAVQLEILVDRGGRVTSVNPSRRWPASGPLLAAARAVVSEWRFRPFERNGRPVAAAASVGIAVHPPERLPQRRAPFPNAAPEQVTVRLDRTGCFGTCPDYSVSVRGDGRVTFDGRSNVLVPGEREYRIPAEAARALIELFRASGFWSLDPQYRDDATDQAENVLTVSADRAVHGVVDYAGLRVGMPDVVVRLQRAVDDAADTARWVRGNEGTLEALAAGGFDFRSEDAGRLLVEAIGRAQDALALALLDRGAPLSAPARGCHGCWERDVHEEALAAAIRHGRRALFDRLANDARLRRIPDFARDDLLLAAAQVRSPMMVERLLAAGASRDAASHGGGGLLLHVLSDAWEVASDADQVALVRMLLARGADIHARDGIFWTALQHAYDDSPEIVTLLLAAGADVDAAAADGTPLLYLTEDEDIALLALAAGADRARRDMHGRTLAEIARFYGWRRVERLLARDAG